MPLPSKPLDPELLYLFVLGPGTGETVLLRVPPDDWVIIDSYLNADRPAAEAIVDEFGGTVSIIVLTHPHQDHYKGFIELIDENPNAVIGCVHPKHGTEGIGVPTDPIALLNQQAKPTYDRIWDEWKADERRKWQTFRHETQQVGDGTLTSLHPVKPLGAAAWHGAARNDMSSGMRFEWHDVVLLLGADVTNASWPEIAGEFADLAEHHALKVPHHASREAIHETYGKGDRGRIWIVTPFASQKLPRCSDGDGLAMALQFVDTVHLTSLPYSHDCEGESPCTTTRSEIDADTRPISSGPVTSDTDLRVERYVAIAFDKKGQLQERWNGAGTLEVTE
ncbi:MAG: MBL fold metallo-hydrolase [Planctomycetaceae bacterium]|nr:MBL fold metallo-hydrolase [Planctomycetaceae bacterium]